MVHSAPGAKGRAYRTCRLCDEATTGHDATEINAAVSYVRDCDHDRTTGLAYRYRSKV